MRAKLLTPIFVVIHVIALHITFLYFGEIPEVEAGTQRSSPQPLSESEEQQIDVEPPSRPGHLSLKEIYEEDGQHLAPLGQGWIAELSIDPWLQARTTRILDRGRVPFGAVVVLDVKTGQVLAMSDRFDAAHKVSPKLTKGAPHLALRAIAPGASLFKIITAAGLMELGVSPKRSYPYLGARRRIRKSNLEKLSRRAPRSNIGKALATSNNGFFARMADQYLGRKELEILSQRFGFNQALPFPLLSEASTAQVPRSRLERARMAAGFWHTRMTPMHAALIALAVAGDGQAPAPRLVHHLRDPQGRRIPAPQPETFIEAMDPKIAAQLGEMMTRTLKEGTARRAFKKWPKDLRHIKIAGKTGSLARRDPYTFYSWFVGFAPAEEPEIVIAVMVANGELWWQRASDISRSVLAAYFRRQLKSAKKG